MQAVGRRISRYWIPISPYPSPVILNNSIRRRFTSSTSLLSLIHPPHPSTSVSIAQLRNTPLNQPHSSDSFAPPCCPLCFSSSIHLFAHQSRVRNRLVHQCDCCKLIFVQKKFHASEKETKLRYDAHRNDLTESNSGYRSSLMQLVEPLARLLQTTIPASATRGLDFGCGPTLALSVLLREAIPQCHIDSYDPIYQPNDSLLSTALSHPYDFIALNEVIEHMSDPALELTRLWSMLRPGGLLAIGTQRVSEQLEQAQMQYMQKQSRTKVPTGPSTSASEPSLRNSRSRVQKDKPKPKLPLSPFEDWWYSRDFTHITFYSHRTFDWIEQHWQPTLSSRTKIEFPSEVSNQIAANGRRAHWRSVFQGDSVWIAQRR